MKRKALSLLVFLLALLLPTLTLATDVALPDTAELPTSFFSWETIGTFSGAVAAVVFLVQLLKLPLDRVKHVPTQYIVYGVALLVLLLAQAFVPGLGGLSWQTGILCVFNAILVSLTAMSVYEVMIQKPEVEKYLANGIDDNIEKIAAAIGMEVSSTLTETIELDIPAQVAHNDSVSGTTR